MTDTNSTTMHNENGLMVEYRHVNANLDGQRQPIISGRVRTSTNSHSEEEDSVPHLLSSPRSVMSFHRPRSSPVRRGATTMAGDSPYIGPLGDFKLQPRTAKPVADRGHLLSPTSPASFTRPVSPFVDSAPSLRPQLPSHIFLPEL